MWEGEPNGYVTHSERDSQDSAVPKYGFFSAQTTVPSILQPGVGPSDHVTNE